MSIKVTCPNGHSLKIKAKYAGKTGRCPICKARLTVPSPDGVDVFVEDSIMDVLQPTESGLSIIALRTPEIGNDPNRVPGEVPTQMLKICPACHRQIPADALVCLYCNTDLATADASD
jgi:hypothetical protein